MKRLILETVTGLSLSLLGFWLGITYFADMINSSPLLLSVSISLIIVGVYLLYRAGKKGQHNTYFSHTPHHDLTYSKPRPKSLLQQHHEMSSSYTKTSELRDKLRMLKKIG